MIMIKQNRYFPQSVLHPGTILAEKLEETGMEPKEFAIRIGEPEETITTVLNGKSSLTAAMALRFEQVTQIPAHFWMNFQQRHDAYIAYEQNRAAKAETEEWAREFPIAAMVKKNWLPALPTMQQKAAALLFFFE